jgi:hypothetical protein
MELQPLSAQASAIQTNAVSQQGRRQTERSEEITRKEAEDARQSSQSGDRVTLSRESRDIAVQQADQTQRQDETQRADDTRARENERQDQARLREAGSPQSISQALKAYVQTSLV